MRRGIVVVVIASAWMFCLGRSAHTQNKDLGVDELAEILRVATWRVPINIPLAHDLAAGLILLPTGTVHEQSKVNLYADRLRIVGRHPVLFVVRERDDGYVEISMKTAQGSTRGKFLPPRSWTVSVSYPADKIESFADKLVLVRFLDGDGAAVAAIAYLSYSTTCVTAS